jgi:hypothetical protein
MHERHGHNQRGNRTATYNSWVDMKKRCSNPKHKNYADYGGRGISVCEAWSNSFASFLADMGERPDGLTLDRIDNSKGYEPGNCRWATRVAQARNRRVRKDSKLDWDKARLIHIDLNAGMRPMAVATKYSISPSQVTWIKQGKIWNLERKLQK